MHPVLPRTADGCALHLLASGLAAGEMVGVLVRRLLGRLVAGRRSLFGVPMGLRRRACRPVGVVRHARDAARSWTRPASGRSRTCLLAGRRRRRAVGGGRAAVVAVARSPRPGSTPPGPAGPASSSLLQRHRRAGLPAGRGGRTAWSRRSRRRPRPTSRALESEVAQRDAELRALRAQLDPALPVQQPELDRRPDHRRPGAGARDVPAARRTSSARACTLGRVAGLRSSARWRWSSSICASSRCGSAPGSRCALARRPGDGRRLGAAAAPAAARRERRPPRHRHASRRRHDRRSTPGGPAIGS